MRILLCTLSRRSDLSPKIFPEPGKYPLISYPPLMIKRLQRSSPELRLLLELNRPGIRDDPWNAAPHILAAVERADNVYLCLKRLSEYNQPPLVRVIHYIDFFRQILEVFYSLFLYALCFTKRATIKGLSSLHERCIAGLSCADPSSYMVDLSSAPLTSAIFSHDPDAGLGSIGPQQFDRVSYPVKYYLVNYTNASYIHKKSISSSSMPGSPTRELESLDTCPFRKDVQDSATMIDGLLSDVSLQKIFSFYILLKVYWPGSPNFFEVQTLDQGNDVWWFHCRQLSPLVRGTLSCARSSNIRIRRPARQHQ